jgi:hypothetical protein
VYLLPPPPHVNVTHRAENFIEFSLNPPFK